MPVPLRRFYAQKLIDAKNKEAEQIKQVSEKKPNDIPKKKKKKS